MKTFGFGKVKCLWMEPPNTEIARTGDRLGMKKAVLKILSSCVVQNSSVILIDKKQKQQKININWKIFAD